MTFTSYDIYLMGKKIGSYSIESNCDEVMEVITLFLGVWQLTEIVPLEKVINTQVSDTEQSLSQLAIFQKFKQDNPTLFP